MIYPAQKKIMTLISGAFLGSFLLLPFLTHADTAINPIANPGLETASSSDAAFPEHWNKGFWGTNDAVFTYPAPGVNGTKAAKVEITNYTDGDAKWFFEEVPVHSGERHVFSGNYTATTPADVVARYTLQNGSYQYAYLGTSVISTDWTGYETLPFIIPKDVISLTVFHLIHEAGSLSVDNLSLRQLAPTEPLPLTPSFMTPMTSGGAVPLSYIIGIKNTAPNEVEKSVPVPPSTQKEPTIIDTVLEKINNMGTLTYTRHPESANDSRTISFIHPAEAAEKTPSNFSSKEIIMGVAPLGILANTIPDLTLAFSGLLLIALSIAITVLLLGFQTRKRERETQLWDL